MRQCSLQDYLHDLSSTALGALTLNQGQPDYVYAGYCPQSQQHYQLPRTPGAKAAAKALMHQLAVDDTYGQEGKMYGVLLVQTVTGEMAYLKAFSGLLQGQATRPGWVPPIPGRSQVALQEAHTLEVLETIKHRLIELQTLPERARYQALLTDFDHQRQVMNQRHRQRKRQRDHQRQQLQKALQGASLQIALEALAQESRRDKAELRGFKRAKAAQLTPLETRIQAADATIRRLRQQRKILSCELQEAMHRSYRLTNFAGQSLTVQALAGDSPLPTGTGDCCAPKLLHFAAEHGLEPLAMAEFWWGPDTADRRQGEFYGACAERCQPIMGFMLAGLSVKNNRGQVNANLSVPVLYEDEWLIVVDKPAGLLSVPGRYGHGQDSVLSRLRLLLPDGETLAAVHRLDRDTSGILVLARHQEAERLLRQQFQSRQVGKTYEALVDGYPTLPEGTITLPLRGNPADRPRQSVDWERGRPSTTRYRVIGQDGPVARIEFYPITGRTHQLRVHAAHAKGLNAPIVGDRLYGMANHRPRLCLHARELTLWHPHHGQALVLRTPTPF